MSPSNAPSIHVLPPEVIAIMCAFAVEDGPALCRVSHTFRQLSQQSLYRSLTIRDESSLHLLVRTLSTPESGQVVRHVRALIIQTSRVDWREALALAALLQPVSNNIVTLKVRFPASDLPLAIEFFQSLSPVEFEWITSPCWLIRPAELFTHFLKGWTRLRTVRLGNFCYDSQFASCIAQLSTISRLTLLGGSNKNLDPEVLRVLLSHPTISRRLRVLEIGDCPAFRRDMIAKEIGLGQSERPKSAGLETCPIESTAPTTGEEEDEEDDERWLHPSCFEDLFRPIKRSPLTVIQNPLGSVASMTTLSSDLRAVRCPYLAALHQAASITQCASADKWVTPPTSPIASRNFAGSSFSVLEACAAGKAAAVRRLADASSPASPILSCSNASAPAAIDRRLEVLRWVE